MGRPDARRRAHHVTRNIKRIACTNRAGYSNPEVGRLFEQARDEAEAEKRRALFSQVQKILVQDVPPVWLMELTFPTIHENRLRNVITTATGVQKSFDGVFFAA